MRPFTEDEVRLTRAHAQRLIGKRGSDPVEVVRDLVGVQAQDMPAARMALRPRTTGVDAEAVRKAYNEDRTLVRIWAMRGTLHMVTADDAGWIVGLLGPVFAAADQRRRDQLGLHNDMLAKAMPILREIVAENGPITRADLVQRLNRKGVFVDPTTQAPAHLIGYAAMTGVICRGPDVEKEEPTYILIERWAGKHRQRDHDEALAELARRYVASRGPVTPEDFRKWSGLPIRRARYAFDLVGGELREVDAAGEPAWVSSGATRCMPRKEPSVELIGLFDEYLLGYASRDLVVARGFANRIQAGGFVKPAVLLDGRVVGTWRQKRTAKKVTIEVEPFEDVTAIESYIESAALDIGRFLRRQTELRLGRPG
jgi:Winged helix DNA-binding domain